MKLTDKQLFDIRDRANRAGDTDLAAMAADAMASPTARALVEYQHAPCAECEDPIRVRTQDEANAAFLGEVVPDLSGPRAHHDCDHPEHGIAGPEHGYTPSGFAGML
jgi:hypothetical protein